MSQVVAANRASAFVRRFLIPIVLLFGASVAVRVSRYQPERISHDVAASYHVLLTVEAFDRIPARVHHFLPLVTLDRPFDRGVPFGAAVMDSAGRSFYTSFPPLGFIAPWAFFKVTGLAPSLAHLMVFNVAIHLVATLLIGFLVFSILEELDVDRPVVTSAVLLSAATYLFTFEAMYSHGLVYWHQSLFQVAWLAQLIVLARILCLEAREQPVARTLGVALFVLSVLGPSIEWTGYIADAAVAGVLWFASPRTPRRTRAVAAFQVLAAASLAGLVFVLHFGFSVGWAPLLEALRGRAAARSLANSSLHALRLGYWNSFGILIPFTAFAVVIWRLTAESRLPRWIMLLMLAAIFPLIENILLLQHAVIYDYDRLKALVPLTLGASLSIALMKPVLRPRVGLMWAAVVAWSVMHPPNRAWGQNPALSDNDPILAQVRRVAKPCTVYATDGYPRGWAVLTVGANMYEAVPSLDSLARIVEARHACQGVYLPVRADEGEGLYVWKMAAVFTPATSNRPTRIDTLAAHAPPTALGD